jgi:nitrate reductase NapE component
MTRAQSLLDSGDSSGPVAATTPAQPALTYTRPPQATKVRNYLFDAFGPYPIVGAALVAGFGQATNIGPKWGYGAEGYGRRFGSDFTIAAIGTTTRYALSEAFKEDTLYYRCECQGVLPRLRHAVISTLTARRGEDGRRVFSFPALVAPYAGTMAAVYGWYPHRYGARDALRMGSYSMVGYVAGNIGLEFLYSGPHSLRNRLHLNNGRGAPNSGFDASSTGN